MLTAYRIKGSRFYNPLLYFFVAWLIVLFAYHLYWSDLLPRMTVSILFFIVFTLLVSLLFFFFSPRLSFVFQIDSQKELYKLKVSFILTFILFLTEAFSAKSFPLLDILLGRLSYGDFGLPFVHVIYYAYSSVCCSLAFLYYNFTSNKKFLKYVFLFLSPGVLIVTRSYIMYNLVYLIIIYFSSSFINLNKKKKIKSIIVFSVLLSAVVLIFGIVGEVRSTSGLEKSTEKYIYIISKPNKNFGNKNPLLLWVYCYITTPLGNLINTINSPIESPLTNISDLDALFFINLPDLVNKRVFNLTRSVNLVVPYFNVSTNYAISYIYLGMFGLYYSFFTILLWVIVIYKLKRNNIYSFLSFIYLGTILFFNIFTNMFNFMGLCPQLWLALLLMFSKDIKFLIVGRKS